MKIACEFGQQCARFGGRDLVLDRDVESRNALILRRERAGEMVGDMFADREQIGTVYAKGDAGAQRINVAERSRRRRRVGGDTANQPVELAQARRWQLMKQCDVGAKLIAFGREMRGTQRVEVALVRRTHRRGHDDGCGASGLDGRGEARASYLKPPR